MKKSAGISAKLSGTFFLGKLPIHRMGFGAMRLTGQGIWGKPKDVNEAKAVLKHAIQLGVNFIDTADSYGPEVSENLIAEALHPYPSGLVIATKGGLTRPGPDVWTPDGHPDYLKKCVEGSLKRLRIDCIDLYQLHRIDPKVPMEDSLGALKEMQDQGKIRYIGLSEVTVPEIKQAQKTVKIMSVQNLYNIENKKSQPVLEYCEKHDLAFIPWFPLGSGKLSEADKVLNQIAESKDATPFQVAIAWLLKRSPVMVPIPGTSSIAHLEENVAASAIKLTDQEMSLLDNAG